MVAGAAALALSGCGGSDGDRADGGTNSQAVAFMADVHFQDVYGDLKNSSFKGVPTANGMSATIRTMYAQLTSTRLFNENYFAFRAALDDSLAKGVKLVAFPGDFSDDGQPLNVNGFRAVLAEYEKKGMRFFIAPGNHDPVAPYDDDEKGKDDFMAANGSTVKVYAKNYQGCLNAEANVVCTDQLMEQGYASLLRDLAPYGLMPNEKDVYWETPYSTYAQDKYSYAEAARQAQLGQRSYEICKEGEGGRFKQAGYTNCTSIADVSYLVEPVKGLWLLSVDANVFVPDKLDPAKPNSPKGFTGAGNAGWNKMTTHKKSVMAWIESVSARAKAQGKQLVAFSHYPTMDFYANQTDAIKAAFKPGAFQTARVPEQATAEAVAATGLPLHIGGHMHFNGTNDYLSKSGKYLVNVQSPSLAVYGAAYKIVRFDTPRKVDVQTVALNNVPRFNELFPLYEMEWKYVEGSSKPEDAKRRWDKAILSSTSYGDFTSRYFGELSRLRFLDEYWACDMKDLVSQLNLQQMLTMAQLDTRVTYAQLAGLAAQGVAVPFKPLPARQPRGRQCRAVGRRLERGRERRPRQGPGRRRGLQRAGQGVGLYLLRRLPPHRLCGRPVAERHGQAARGAVPPADERLPCPDLGAPENRRQAGRQHARGPALPVQLQAGVLHPQGPGLGQAQRPFLGGLRRQDAARRRQRQPEVLTNKARPVQR